MALFFKNAAEKKLKELTGGMFLNKSFTNRLKKEGLTVNDGLEIQKEIKESIKRDDVKAEGVETRLNFLIEQKKKAKLGFKSGHNDLTKNPRYTGDNGKTTKNPKPVTASGSTDHNRNPRYKGDNKRGSRIKKQEHNTKEIEVLTADSLENLAKDDGVKEIKFLINQEHNLKECPKCRAKILKYDPFCYRCGADVHKARFDKDLDNLTQKSASEELSDLEKQYNESISTLDELSELEKLYNKKVSTKYSPEFKFAYVIYLDQLNRNPNKEPKESMFKNYEVPLQKLKKQADEDEFIGEGSPLIAAQGAKVSEIRDILKEHDLKVSGKKEELIERLGENLSEEELKEAFPKRTLAVTDEGLEFIEKNRHVFYYDKASPLRTHIDVESFDSIFDDADDLSDENMYKLIIDYLLKREDELVNDNKWGQYRYNLMALGRVYKDSGDDLKLLDADFKLFIAGINNFNDYTNQSEPAYGYIGKTYAKELIDLLHSLSLSIDELKAKFGESYDDLKYPDLKISKEESLVYLLKLFSGEDIQDLTLEIHSKYPDPNMRFSY